uniref:Uncharacterized protein n=1 Tax=Anguilla anguilla TaxID=7936 RepID=A0A0E9SSU6_ANGAN
MSLELLNRGSSRTDRIQTLLVLK